MRGLSARALGAVVLAACVGAATGSSQAGEAAARDVRLVVSCDEATRPKVLAALASLDVLVHDLATMQRVPLPGAVDEVAIHSARRVWDAMNERFADVRSKSTVGLEVTAVDIGHGRALVRVAGDIATLDEASTALAGSTIFVSGSVRRGPLRTKDGLVEGEITLQIAPEAASDSLAPSESQTLPLAQIRDAGNAVGSSLLVTSAQQVTRDASGEVLSAHAEFSIPDLVAAKALLEKLDQIPGLRVTGLNWRASPKAKPYPVRVQVAMRRGG